LNLSFFIAKRYLFSKKSNNAITIISWISISAIAVTTAALIIILSAMNGLTSVVSNLYNSFEPDLNITYAKGKHFELNAAQLEKLKAVNGVKTLAFCLQDKALLKNGDLQGLVSVKGVSSNYVDVVKIDSAVVDGSYVLKNDKTNFALIGRGVAGQLQINPSNFIEQLALFSPKKGKDMSLNPDDNFSQVYVTPSGVFSLNDDFDFKYIFIDLALARKLFEEETRYSSIEIACNKSTDINTIRKDITSILGTDYKLTTKYEANAILFKSLETEKLVTFIILGFVLLIATFNIIGALTMLIIEKQKDIHTLYCLGASQQFIRAIFMREGLLITLFGAFIGLVLGLLVCYAQIQFHLVKFGTNFIIDYYPVELQWHDLMWICSLILAIGFFAALYPVRVFTKNNLV
jgi:lipoprotein-releasing system permease protein